MAPNCATSLLPTSGTPQESQEELYKPRGASYTGTNLVRSRCKGAGADRSTKATWMRQRGRPPLPGMKRQTPPRKDSTAAARGSKAAGPWGMPLPPPRRSRWRDRGCQQRSCASTIGTLGAPTSATLSAQGMRSARKPRDRCTRPYGRRKLRGRRGIAAGPGVVASQVVGARWGIGASHGADIAASHVTASHKIARRTSGRNMSWDRRRPRVWRKPSCGLRP